MPNKFFRLLVVVSTLFFSSALVLPSAYAAFEPILDDSAMDLSADPCSNFEQYACGAWNERTVIPADKSRWSRSFNSIAEENLTTERQLLEDFSAGKKLNLAANAKKLGDFYGACMDTASISSRTNQFLEKEIARINNLNFSTDTISRLVGELQNRGIDVFMSFSSDQDLVDSSQTIARLDQGGLGLPGRDYYYEASNAAIREKYRSHIAKMLELSGFSADVALLSAQNIMDFETELAQKALRPVERRDPKSTYHMKTIAELKQLAPSLNWDLLFSVMGSSKFEKLNVAVPEFFTHLNALLVKTPLEQIKAYLIWHLISSFSGDLGGDYAQQNFEFFGKVLQGQKEITPRWKYCLNEADSSLTDALGEAFVAKTFGQESKTKAVSILSSIQKSFEKNLTELDWMDAPTRQYAVEKLNAIMKKIGYPDKWRDISAININKDHMSNVLACAQFNKQWELSKIGKPVDRSEWMMTPPTVNAYYNPSNNEIVFPAGILQSPIFSLKAPMGADYGAFGMVVGHEITHGFDDEGRQYDLMGNLRDWWTPGINEVFDKKAQCLVDQYSQYTVADGVHIDGKLTLGENIADLGGMKMTLAALEASFPSVMSETEKTAEKKKFFIAYGQVWCSKATPEYEKLAASKDPHAPPRFRINGVLTNTPEFAKTFSCPAGKPLAPVNRCSVW